MEVNNPNWHCAQRDAEACGWEWRIGRGKSCRECRGEHDSIIAIYNVFGRRPSSQEKCYWELDGYNTSALDAALLARGRTEECKARSAS